MPPLKELINRPKNPDGTPKQWIHSQPLSTLQPQPEDGKNLPTDTSDPYINPVLRCALPAIGESNSDSLRQWYRQGTTQFRILVKP